MNKRLLVFSVCGLTTALHCDRAPPAPPAAAPGAGASASTAATHARPIELGTVRIGPFDVRAARDAGAIRPGGEAPIDVWLTGGKERVSAVRFWIGTHDAAGSVKARADIENPDEPNHWHTHVEVPDPLPAGARRWVEIEREGEAVATGSFALHG